MKPKALPSHLAALVATSKDLASVVPKPKVSLVTKPAEIPTTPQPEEPSFRKMKLEVKKKSMFISVDGASSMTMFDPGIYDVEEREIGGMKWYFVITKPGEEPLFKKSLRDIQSSPQSYTISG